MKEFTDLPHEVLFFYRGWEFSSLIGALYEPRENKKFMGIFMIKLNKKIVLFLFIGLSFSHSMCPDFFTYHSDRIYICNSQESLVELMKEKIRLYKKKNAIYVVGKQSDIIKFLYESNFRLKRYKIVNDVKIYSYFCGNILATNGMKNLSEKLNLLPEDIPLLS